MMNEELLKMSGNTGLSLCEKKDGSTYVAVKFFLFSLCCLTKRHEGALVERRYSSYSFSTSVLYGS
jgi:hypothetical protein